MKEFDKITEGLEKEFGRLEDRYADLCSECIKLDEASGINALDDELSSLTDRFEAARKGLSLVNSLRPGESKVRNTRRVMSNLSKIRTALLDLEKKIKTLLLK